MPGDTSIRDRKNEKDKDGVFGDRTKDLVQAERELLERVSKHAIPHEAFLSDGIESGVTAITCIKLHET